MKPKDDPMTMSSDDRAILRHVRRVEYAKTAATIALCACGLLLLFWALKP